ncbi:hypothetical protein TSAR_000199 [Trichomalopsis sarcophagae]|uniref:Uncharacterized protein n=1 Tax=Trichomalopsis sarcophagae TaxID=543379 RepID=A0A232F6J1_9HYME|nr:hypothetical protein TSAR_000199 [Trichomalopsis sarcophagae]
MSRMMNSDFRPPDPQKRKPLHAAALLDEITDNVKNSAVVTRSKKLKEMQSDQSNDSDDDLDVITSDSASEDETSNRSLEKVDFMMNSKGQIRTRSNVRKSTKVSLQEFQKEIEQTKGTRKIKIIKKYQISSNEPLKKNKNNTNYMLYIVACIIFILLLYYINNIKVFAADNTNNDMKEISETERVESVVRDVLVTLKSMKSKYKNQEKELWQNAYVAIVNIIRNPKKPSIIVLLGDKSDPLDCLAVLLGNVSSNALNSGSLILTPDKFDSDMGTVIESLKVSIQNKKAVIVWDLLNINTEALKAFHNLCDRINPLVEEVIFIITIITDGYDKKSNPIEFVEKELFKKLSGTMKKDAIQPLITRITDGPILTVKPEPNIEECPLPKANKI